MSFANITVCSCISTVSRGAHLALLGLSPQHLGGGRALPEEQPQGVLLQTHVPDGPGRLARLLAGVDEHQHLRESRAVGGVGRSEGVGVERRGQSQSITEEVDDVLLQSASVLHLLCLVPSLCIEQTLNDNVTKKCNVK